MKKTLNIKEDISGLNIAYNNTCNGMVSGVIYEGPTTISNKEDYMSAIYSLIKFYNQLKEALNTRMYISGTESYSPSLYEASVQAHADKVLDIVRNIEKEFDFQ